MELLTYLSSLSILNLFSRMPAAAAQGIIWGIMALGVYITFRDVQSLSLFSLSIAPFASSNDDISSMRPFAFACFAV
mgnify:CR=1 FL=1